MSENRPFDYTQDKLIPALRYTKSDHRGVVIESRSNGGEWGLLGHYMQKPVYDDRPLAVPGTPESRDYRMR